MSTPPEFPEHEAPLGLPPDTDETRERYVGLYTRVIAFVLDAALINLAAIIVAVGASLILSLFHIPKELKTVLAAIAGAAYVVWSIGYFVAFWSSTGQTPGSRLMQIRIVTANGAPFRPRRGVPGTDVEIGGGNPVLEPDRGNQHRRQGRGPELTGRSQCGQVWRCGASVRAGLKEAVDASWWRTKVKRRKAFLGGASRPLVAMPDSYCWIRGRSGDAVTTKSQRFTQGDLLGPGWVGR